MNLRTIRILGIASALCMVLAVPVLGQQQPVQAGTARFGAPASAGRKYESYLYGVIKTIDANGMVLENTKFGFDRTFKFRPKTVFIHDNKPSSQQDLKIGDKVWVDFKEDKKNGDLYAKKVVTGIVPAE